jgi:WD40 repeat protein
VESKKPVAAIESLVARQGGTDAWPRDLALSADRTRLAICWDSGGLTVYDLANLAEPAVVETLPQERGNQVCFVTNERLAVGSTYGVGHLWTLGRSEPDLDLQGHRDKICSIAVAPDGKRIATAARDGGVRIWPLDEITNGKELARFQKPVRRLLASPVGDELALFVDDSAGLAVVRLGSDEVQTLPLDGEAKSLAYVAGGRQLAVAIENAVVVFERPSGMPVWQWTWPEPKIIRGIQELRGVGDLLIVRGDHKLTALTIKNPTVEWKREFSDGLWGLASSPDQRCVYVGDQLVQIHEVRAADGVIKRVLKGPTSPANEIEISPDGRLLLSAYSNRQNRLWDRTRGTLLRNLATAEDSLGTMRFVSGGRTVMARHDRFFLGFWHVASGQRLVSTGPWGTYNVQWDLSRDGRTAYLAVSTDNEAVVRTLDLDQPHPITTAAQIDPPRPD